MTRQEKLRRRLNAAAEDDELLKELLEDAESYVLAYTGREVLPLVLEGIVLEMACVMYNRRGMQGETGHAEGGISITAEGLPEEIRLALNRFRVAKVV